MEYFDKLGFSEEEIAEKETELREEGCMERKIVYNEYSIPTVRFCEGDFKENAVNNLLVCSKCGHAVNIIACLEYESDFCRDNEPD